jgi:hypothetical protein
MNEKKLEQAGISLMSANLNDITSSISLARQRACAFVKGLAPVKFSWTGSVLALVLRSDKALDKPALRLISIAFKQVAQINIGCKDEHFSATADIARLVRLEYAREYPTRCHIRAVFDTGECNADASVIGEGAVEVEYLFVQNDFAKNALTFSTLESLCPRRFLVRDRQLFVWYAPSIQDEIEVVSAILEGVASIQFKRGQQVFFRNVTVQATAMRGRMLRVSYLLAAPMPAGWIHGRVLNQDSFADQAAQYAAERIADRDARLQALWNVADAAEELWRKSGLADMKFIYHGHVYRRA